MSALFILTTISIPSCLSMAFSLALITPLVNKQKLSNRVLINTDITFILFPYHLMNGNHDAETTGKCLSISIIKFIVVEAMN